MAAPIKKSKRIVNKYNYIAPSVAIYFSNIIRNLLLSWNYTSPVIDSFKYMIIK